MNLNIWQLSKKNENLKEFLVKKHGISGIALDVLLARGKDLKNCDFEETFFKNSMEQHCLLKDVEKAADRLNLAIRKNEKIAVFADYDCDGICSAAIFNKYFSEKGANFVSYIPERDEGYGLNFKVLDKLKKSGVKVVVTVDSGIVAFKEAKYLKELGMELIVTDHHKVLDVLPDAVAVVNPKRKDCKSYFKDISGAVVLFKLIAAMEKKPCEDLLDDYADLLAISTIGDVMPLIFENRFIVKKGLQVLKKTKNVGLKKLLQLSFNGNVKNMTALDVAFSICPKLNSAGRLNSAATSFKLLVAKTEKEAELLANRVVEYDLRRKKLQEEMFQEAMLDILNDYETLNSDVIIVFKENWPVGLTGLVAAKILSIFKKPAFVFSKQGEILIGSARSFEGFSVYEALKNSSQCFIKWGGHNLAGGLSLNFCNFNLFKEQILNFSKKNKPELYKIKIDCEINPRDVDFIAAKSLEVVGPFGHGNKEPVFLIRKAVLRNVVAIGENKHLKLRFSFGNFNFQVLFFNKTPCSFYFKPGEVFNLLVNVGVNCYRNVNSVSFKMVDFRPYEICQEKIILDFYEFSRIVFDDVVFLANKNNDKFPKRDDFVYVYGVFRDLKIFYGNEYDLFLLVFRNISFFKLLVILKFFSTKSIIKRKKEMFIFANMLKKC